MNDQCLAAEEISRFIHQLNNMLMVIQGNAELITLNEGVTEEGEEIIRSCRKCLEIVNKIRRRLVKEESSD